MEENGELDRGEDVPLLKERLERLEAVSRQGWEQVGQPILIQPIWWWNNQFGKARQQRRRSFFLSFLPLPPFFF